MRIRISSPRPPLSWLGATWALFALLVLLGVGGAEAQTGSPPTITSFTPMSGEVGTSVVIDGTGFVPPISIIFGGDAAAAGTFTSTEITVTVPTGAETGPITVNTAGGSVSTATVFTLGTVTAPTITSATTAGGTIGQPFSYQIVASGTPTSYGATGLPAGLSVDMTSGLIAGTPTAAGTFVINLGATNAGGTGTATLTLTLSDLPAVTLTVPTPTVTLGSSTPGQFALSIPSAQPNDLTVAYTIKGTAINGTDYAMLKGTAKIKAGKTKKPINIVPLGDLEGASKVTVKLTLAAGTGYTIGTTTAAKVKILAAGQ